MDTEHIMANLSYANKEKMLRVLIEQMNSDGKIDAKEEQFLENLSQKLGVSSQRLQSLQDQYQHSVHTLPEFKSMQAKKLFITQMAQLSLMDGMISSQELKLLKEVAQKIDFPKNRIKKLITAEEKKLHEQAQKILVETKENL
jgi:uncharacterized tellurite resistance protein B-like protein